MTLLNENHPIQDFLVPDLFDGIGASFKSDMASMEHPIFTLSKNRDMRNLEYRRENISISIIPSNYGLPTVFDKDVILYCMSLLMREINEGKTPTRTIRISCHNLLVATNRLTNGRSYQRLKSAIDRLRGVSIKTNVRTNKREITRGFGLIESYEIIESSRVKDRMVRLEITLSEWLYNAVLGKDVLTINREYFRLGKPMERRLYEIARKHCGRAPEWEIGLIKLMEKTGSTGTLRLFRSRLKLIAKDDHLPDYKIHVDNNDKVTFSQKNPGKSLESITPDELPMIKRETILKGEKIVREAGTGWCYNNIREQFTKQLIDGFRPNNVDGTFIGFVKDKVKQPR